MGTVVGIRQSAGMSNSYEFARNLHEICTKFVRICTNSCLRIGYRLAGFCHFSSRCHGSCYNSGTPSPPGFAKQSSPASNTCALPSARRKNRGACTPPSSCGSFADAAAHSCPSESHSFCRANTVYNISAPSNDHQLARVDLLYGRVLPPMCCKRGLTTTHGSPLV